MTDPQHPDHDVAARTLSAHVNALGSWGIRRIRFVRDDAGLPGSEAAAVPGTGAAADASTALQDGTDTAPEGGEFGVPDFVRARAAKQGSPQPGQASEPSAEQSLETCASEVASCERCALAQTRTRTVFGVGNPRARLMFVGEAPGHDEDVQGEPFVGKAGQLLDKIIAAMGLRREDVYIANVLKCRPPGNRDPQPQEVASCTPYLERQIDQIQPEIIVALGRPASNYLLGSTESLGRLRGGDHSYRGIRVVATYHPAYLLRNPAEKKKVWHDLQAVIQALDLTPVTPRRGPASGG